MSTADPTDDTAQVKHLGYDQELKRQHGKLSLLGMAFNILNTWTALACSFNLALPSGGPSVVLWGLAVAAVCSLCLSASMAEFASVYPV